MKRRKIRLVAITGCVLVLSFAGCQTSGKEVVQERTNGISLMEEQKYEEAVDAFDKALRAKKVGKELERDIGCYKASALYRMGEYEEAVKAYTEIPSYEKDGEILYLRGVSYLALEQKEKAVEDFKNAVFRDSKNYELYIDIYSNLSAHGYEKEGEAYLRQVIEKSSGGNELAYLRRGRAYYYLGDTKNAQKELKQAKEKGSSVAVMYLGILEEEKENYEDAVEIYRKYLEDNKEDAKIYNRMAICKIKLKDESALAFIEEGLKYAKEDAETKKELLYHEIVAYENMMDFDIALEKAEEFLSLYPNDEDVQKEYDFLKTR